MNELDKKYEALMWMIGSLTDNGYIKEEVKDEIWDEIKEFYEIAKKNRT